MEKLLQSECSVIMIVVLMYLNHCILGSCLSNYSCTCSRQHVMLKIMLRRLAYNSRTCTVPTNMESKGSLSF